MLRRLSDKNKSQPQDKFKTPKYHNLFLPFGLLGAAIAILTAGGIAIDFHRTQEEILGRLRTTAQFQTQRINDWLNERMTDAKMLREDFLNSDLDLNWFSDNSPPPAGKILLHQIATLLEEHFFQAISIFDFNGKILWKSNNFIDQLDVKLSAAIQQASKNQTILAPQPYHDENGYDHLDFLVPLPASATLPGLVILLHCDPKNTLDPLVKTWPIQSRTGETLLFRRVGEQILYLTAARYRPDSSLRMHIPVTSNLLLAAQLIRDPNHSNQILNGVDYRGVPAFGVGLPVQNTDWFLITKIDRMELYEQAAETALWIGLTGLLALMMAMTGAEILRQRQQLNLAATLNQSQIERINALNLLEAVAESSQDAIFAKGIDGKYLFINQAAAHWFNRSSSEILGYDDEQILPLPQALAVKKNDQAVITAQRSWTFQETRNTIKGERTLQTTKGPLYDPQGSCIGVFGITRDITEISRAAHTLAEETARRRALIENSRDGIFVLDEQYRIIEVNLRFAELLGYSFDELRNLHLWELDIDKTKQQFHNYLINSNSINNLYETRYRRRNGASLPVEVSLSSVNWANQEWILGLCRDISERLRVAQELERYRHHLEELVTDRTAALRRQTHSLRALIDNIPYLIWMKDQTGHLVASNRALSEALQIPLQELPGKTDYDLWPLDLATRFQQEDAEVMSTGQIKIVQGEILPTQPEIQYEFLRAPILDRAGGVLGTVGFARDISAQLEIERTREAARQAAEAANRAKSTFLANMSHEIRTPINVIVGLTYLLQRSVANREQTAWLNKIAVAAQHLLSILNDILDLAKIEAGHLELEQTPFTLTSILDHVKALIAEQVRSKGITLEIDLDQLPHWLSGDPTRLRQALLNYASNAVKFTRQGSITLRARLVEANYQIVKIRFEVSDTGIGISEHELSSLFTPFAQADASTSRHYGGSGLGLAITQRLAQLMGGETGAVSTPGQGSTFWFTACLTRSDYTKTILREHLPSGQEELLRRQCKGSRILIVEDNMISREVTRQLLNNAELSVDTAQNGREAIAQITVQNYDLILMDLQMPELDGFEATRQIRTLFSDLQLPILAMTASVLKETRQMCLALGMNDFLAKPIEPNVLYGTLLKWLPARTNNDSMNRSEIDEEIPLKSAPKFIESNALPGLNIKKGLTAVNGQLDSYLRLLQMFSQLHGKDLEHLRTKLAANDQQNALTLIYDLKGAAALLGAEQLADLAGSLESLLKQTTSEPIMLSALAELEQELKLVVSSCNNFPSDQFQISESQAATLDLNQTAHLLLELTQLLEADNTKVLTFARETSPQLHAALGESSVDLLHAIERFDFDQALIILRKTATWNKIRDTIKIDIEHHLVDL